MFVFFFYFNSVPTMLEGDQAISKALCLQRNVLVDPAKILFTKHEERFRLQLFLPANVEFVSYFLLSRAGHVSVLYICISYKIKTNSALPNNVVCQCLKDAKAFYLSFT